MVANARPNTIEQAIGIKNWACKDCSNNKGVNPAIVVILVKKMARKLRLLASVMARSGRKPSPFND